jgi:acetylglutamate kinase
VKILIKLGGTLLENASSRDALAEQIAALSRVHSLVVVHGGGKQVTKFLEERGVKSSFVNGLRVSDETVMDAVTKVIAGSVNQQLVSALVAQGCHAVGLSGIDGPLTVAEQLDPQLGFVGRPIKTDGRLLSLLVDNGYLPAIACVAGDRQGNVYNVNADQMAVSCAADWGAERLFFLTDVPGVKNAQGEIMSQLTSHSIRRLISSGVAHGGMQAKLEAAQTAIERGVAEVVIASGHDAQVCSRLTAGKDPSGGCPGTRIHAGKTYGQDAS